MITKFKVLILCAFLLNPIQVFAQGGNDPVPGIDVIITTAGIKGVNPVEVYGLNSGELEKYNSMKAKGRAGYLARIIAVKMNKISEGASPKGGWQKLLQNSLTKKWCGPCKMVAFTVQAKTAKPDASYKITFKPKAGK